MMPTSPKMSMIVAEGNRAQGLLQALTRPPAMPVGEEQAEIIVVLHKRVPDFAEELLGLLTANPRFPVRFVEIPEEDPDAARSAGIAAARSEHLYLLGADPVSPWDDAGPLDLPGGDPRRRGSDEEGGASR